MKKFTIASIFLSLALSLPLFADNYPAPPPSNQYIVDYTGLISTSDIDLINNLCREVERVTGAEMAVLVILTTSGEAHWYYATEVANKWGVGQKSEDNGLLLLVAISDRQVFTATGSGMETIIPDARVDQVYRQILKPYFKKQEYGEGIFKALQVYAKDIQKFYDVELNGTKGAPKIKNKKRSVFWKILLTFFIFWLLPGIFPFIVRGKGKGARYGGFWSGGSSSSSSSSWSSSSSSSGFSGGSFGGGGFSGGGGGGGW